MTTNELKQQKQKLGYTNAQLAKLSGIPLGTVMKVLSGATKCPRRETMLALEKVLSPYRDPAASEPLVLQETPIVYGSSPRKEQLRTIDDYYALPDDARTELIDGVFYNMSSPSIIHQLIIGELFLQFKACERKHKGHCHVILSPCDVQLDKDTYTMLQPDILVVCDIEKIKGRCCYGAPDLTVEVLSPSNSSHDCILKLRKYQSAGVKEYWIIDPQYRSILVYRFGNPGHPDFHSYSFEDTIPVGISDNECAVDFKVISDNLRFVE